MEILEVFNQEVKVGKNKYNFIVKEGYMTGWYRSKRRRPKFYEIQENNKTILSTSLHQTYYSYKKRLLGE